MSGMRDFLRVVSLLFFITGCPTYSGSVVGNGVKGDFNLDGVVDKVDLTYAIACAESTLLDGEISVYCVSVDLDQSGRIDEADFEQIQSDYEPRPVKRESLNEQDFAHLYQCLIPGYETYDGCQDADLNGDESVNQEDMDYMRSHYVPTEEVEMLDLNADGRIDFVGDVIYFAICLERRMYDPGFSGAVDPCYRANFSVLMNAGTDVWVDANDALRYAGLIHLHQEKSESCLTPQTCGLSGREIFRRLYDFIEVWKARKDILDLNQDGEVNAQDLDFIRGCEKQDKGLACERANITFIYGENDYVVNFWDMVKYVKLLSTYRLALAQRGETFCFFPGNCDVTDEEFSRLLGEYIRTRY